MGDPVALARAALELEQATPERVTLRLTPYQRRVIDRLRTRGLPRGARPRPTSRAIIDAVLELAAQLDDS